MSARPPPTPPTARESPASGAAGSDGHGFAEPTFVACFTDVTEARGHADALAWSASHDELTGLPNRSGLQARIDAALTDDGTPLALLHIDLDRFQDVNDSLGHRLGDAVLSLAQCNQALAVTLAMPDLAKLSA